jgi:hypothetical protein
MKKTWIYLILTLALVAPAQSTEAALMRNVVQSCAFGAGVMAATTYMGLSPALNAVVFAVPATDVIIANAIIGCGIGAAGATAATLTGWFYDAIF